MGKQYPEITDIIIYIIILLYSYHLSDEIKSHLINISDHYNLMKTWLIANYGGPARIVGDIVSNLSKKPKPLLGNRKETFSFYAVLL